MGPNSRREYVRKMSHRYLRQSTRQRKSSLIDEVCAVLECHRKHAIRILNAPPRTPPAGHKRRRRKRYGAKVRSALLRIWDAADYTCPALLHPRLSFWVGLLTGKGHLAVDTETEELLKHISLSTVERILSTERHRRPTGRYCPRRKGVSAFVRSVPVEILPRPAMTPGIVDTDVVQHDGGDPHGTFLCTVSFKERYSYWECFEAVWGHSRGAVLGAIRSVYERSPFKWRQMHFDGGREYINREVLGWCDGHGIRYTKGRPYKSNDNARIENANRFTVRRHVGHKRRDNRAQQAPLTEVYRMIELYNNFFHASRKLVGVETHEIDGVRHHRKLYETPRTAYERILASSDVAPTVKARLTRLYKKLDPVTLIGHIRKCLAKL